MKNKVSIHKKILYFLLSEDIVLEEEQAFRIHWSTDLIKYAAIW